MKNYEALIFEGGGVKGIAYNGALLKLEELGILQKIKYVAGTSAGSQAALLVACGYSATEIEKLLSDAPFSKFLDSSWGFLRDMYRLIFKFGYYKGAYLEKYIDNLIYKKLSIQNITFENLYKKTGVVLKVTGTCLNTQNLEWFDHIKTPNMKVAKAIHISSCIPFMFKPVLYESKYYVDGGCLNNLPYNAFINKCTLALNLKEAEECKKIKGFKEFTASLINTILKGANSKVPNDNVDNIDIETGSISAIKFNLSNDEKNLLKDFGYKAVTQHFTLTD